MASPESEIYFGEKCAVVGKRMKCGGEMGAVLKKDAHALLHGRLIIVVTTSGRLYIRSVLCGLHQS